MPERQAGGKVEMLSAAGTITMAAMAIVLLGIITVDDETEMVDNATTILPGILIAIDDRVGAKVKVKAKVKIRTTITWKSDKFSPLRRMKIISKNNLFILVRLLLKFCVI